MENPLGVFGVKGDGVTDDWAALQKAIDETTGVLALGPGTYRLSRGLVVNLAQRGKTEIRGQGARLIGQGPGPVLHIIGTHAKTADPKDVSTSVWVNESTPIIHGLEIMAENPEADGIRLELTWQPIITHVTVHDCRHGIQLVRNNRNVIISECHVYHNQKVGIFLDDVNLHQIIINTNHISYNAGGGIKVLYGNVRNIQICGNDIEYNFARTGVQEPVGDVWFVAGEIGIREATIVGNTIQALRSKEGANVRIEGFGAKGNLKAGLLNITGNLITSQEVNILIINSRGIAIQGNTFILGHQRNIRVLNSSSIAIGPNVIDHNTDYDYSARTEGGIELDGCDDCTINGVVFHNILSPTDWNGAVEVRNSSAINIMGCNITEPSRCAVILRGAHDCRVSDCIIRTGVCAVSEDASSENNLIINNRIIGSGLSCAGKGTRQEGNLIT